MKHLQSMLFVLLAGALALQAQAAPSRWIQGRDYVLLNPVQHTTVAAGKVEVMEVFSYACPFCNRFQPAIEQLKRSLPANAQMVFLPASFIPAEDWPMFQRAYFAAQALGVADKAHQGIFDAVWETGELATMDPNTQRLKRPLPSLEDAARCYERLTGVKAAEFLRVARSFGVDARMQAADAEVDAMQIPGTPCIVVNGKYRINMDSLHSTDDLIDIVKVLVARESGR